MSGPFEGLPPQSEAARLLEAALAAPGHAYLLAGPPGSGKRLYAERFCAALLMRRHGGSSPARIPTCSCSSRPAR